MANYRVKENMALIKCLIQDLEANGVHCHFVQFLDYPKYCLVFPNNTMEVYDRHELSKCYHRLWGIKHNIKKYIDSAQYLNKFMFNRQIPNYYE